jgi:hypothetical protein
MLNKSFARSVLDRFVGLPSSGINGTLVQHKMSLKSGFDSKAG